MIPIKLTIDNREHAVISRLPKNTDINIEIAQLYIGDFQITSGDSQTILIERKTLSDLASSIQDGRYNEQKLRMKSCGHKCVYIVEHSASYFGKIPLSTLQHSMVSTMIRDEIPVYYSSGIDNTIDIVLYISKKMSEWSLKSRDIADWSSTIKTEKKSNMTQPMCFNAQLQQIPGVSVKIAGALSSRWVSMVDMIRDLDTKTTPEKISILSNISVNGKRIGKVGARIHNYLWYTRNILPKIDISLI